MTLFSEFLNKHQIIDMHCHTAGVGGGGSGCFVSPKLQNNWKFKHYLKSFYAAESDLKMHGDQFVVDKIAEKINESFSVDAAIVLAMDITVNWIKMRPRSTFRISLCMMLSINTRICFLERV
ncbi:MAG: hypothetical protein GY804_06400 [Alphaproteobacteria bacterium]|nr:hypothetical protein [Alphaproteobacteria bacterium]